MLLGFIVAIIGLVYIIQGGKNRRVYAEGLVTTSIFTYCLYAGNILMQTGLSMISNSLPFSSITIPAFMFIYQAILRAEEDFLFNILEKGFDD